MNTENLKTLKIHKLSEQQYEREKEKGTLDPTAIYLTPDDGDADSLTVDLDNANAGEPNTVNADTIGGKPEALLSVLTAENASHAITADTADYATNADTLGGKSEEMLSVANSAKLGGRPASDYATETFVVNKIAEAQLGGGEDNEGVDLTGFATKDDIANAVLAVDFPVDSVNGKTGAVQLTADDVRAAPSSHAIDKNNPHAVTAEQTGAVPLDGSAPMSGILTAPAVQIKTDPNGITRTVRWLDADGNQVGAIGYSSSNRIIIRQYETATGYNEYYQLPAITEGLTANKNYNILTTKSPVTIAQGGTGANTAEDARVNLGMVVTLWSGSWSSGSITVPNTANYKMYLIALDGVGTLIPAFRYSGYVRGVGGYANSSDEANTYHFAATLSDEKWTISSCMSIAHAGSTHTPTVDRTVSKIIGVL